MKGREETVQQRTRRKRESKPRSYKPHEPKPKVPPKPSPARKVRTLRGIPVSISGVTVIMSKSRNIKTVKRIKLYEPFVLARMAKRAQDSKRPEVQKKLARVALRMEGSRLRKRTK